MDGSAKVHPKTCPCEKVLSADIASYECNTGEVSLQSRTLLFQLLYRTNTMIVPTPKHNWHLELQLSCVPQSANFDPCWGHGLVEREEWKARRAVMVDSTPVLTADECFQEAGMSRGRVYRLWGLLWVRALWNVIQSHPIPPRIGSKGLQWSTSDILVYSNQTSSEGSTFIRLCLASLFGHGEYFGIDSHLWLTAPAVWVYIAENNREKKTPDPIK